MSSRKREYERLHAELAELDRLIAATSEEAAINRATLEYRRSQVEEEIGANPAPPRWPAHVHLSFNGKPVVDSQGIYAEFASDAVDAFRKAVASLAASRGTVLGKRGVLPNQEDYRLLVTGTSHGSFGFELEEATEPQPALLDEDSPVGVALGRAKDILESLVTDEEAIADAIAETDDRALNDVRGFLQLMVDNEAVCSLSHKNRTFKFRDIGQVAQGLSRLGEDNIQEGQQEISGRFLGFLPQHRTAEFEEDSGEILFCRVGQSVSDADRINASLGERVTIKTSFRQVGKSRPRHTILGYEPAPDDQEDGGDVN
ncbi:MAG: hypothetical protein OXI51_03055 [Chloroflexota bacterium]|nr:hypothetical protein [Chloroflexota bacterium]